MFSEYRVICCPAVFRVGVDGRDAVIDVLIKIIPKNKLAVELFVKVGGTCAQMLNSFFMICNIKANS